MPAALAPADTATPFGNRRLDAAARLAWCLAMSKALSPARRRWLRKRIAGRFPGPFDVAVDGVSFRAYPAENRDDRVLVGRGELPELPERMLLLPLLRQDMVFVDIGANIGAYALWVAARAGPGATALAFEPHPRTFAKLAFNIAANGAAGIAAENVAVAGEDGEMTLFSDGGGNIGHASLLAEGAGKVRSSATVKVAPLASVLAGRGIERIDLVKIDVEGFEDRALLPLFAQAGERLWPRAVLIETALAELWETDCLAALEARGYRRAGATDENVLMVREAGGRWNP